MKFLIKLILLSFISIVTSGSVYASVIGYCNDVGTILAVDNGLSTSDVTLTDAQVASTGDIVIANASISSTNCAGIFDGNDKPLPDGNIGAAEDGFMNGEGFDFFDGGAFITPDYLQDLDGIDQYGDNDFIDDPGWVFLGKDDGSGVDLTSPASVDLSQYMNIDFDCGGNGDFTGGNCTTGNWSLNFTDPDGLLEALEDTVFGDSFFDHLAFSFKFADGFAVYDFDFNILNAVNPLFDLSVPHNLAGEFDLSAYQHNISHISVWARDPVDSITEISEPSSYLLVMISFVLLIGSRQIRH